MNDDRQSELAREPYLRPEHCLLDRFGGEVVVVVEADLADRSCAWSASDDIADERRGFRFAACELTGLMRMHADAKPDARPERG